MVAPSRERGLKSLQPVESLNPVGRSLTGAWIEMWDRGLTWRRTGSLPHGSVD
jgi:hypothetical protein